SWERSTAAGIVGVPVLAIYAPPRGASRLAVRTSSGLFVSDDEGRNVRPAPLPGSDYYIYDVALPLDLGDPILAATSRGLLQSLDGGAGLEVVTDRGSGATV